MGQRATAVLNTAEESQLAWPIAEYMTAVGGPTPALSLTKTEEHW
jgi:hypothetical protein